MADEGLEPFETGTLEVGNGHVLYWEQYGARQGVPVVYLHGGPGSGCTPGIRRAFDPAVHRAVLFDQRASGRSTPHASHDGVDWASIDMNHHVADVEALRTHLDIDRWIVFGVSWGSVLGATYAERHAGRVLGVVLGAVSLGRAEDIDWLTVDAGRFFPAEWRAFRDHVPEPLRGQRLVDAYNTLVMDPDPMVREAAAQAWCDWESAHIATTTVARRNPRYDDPRFRLGFARQVTHCWRNNSWLAPDEIVTNADRLAGIPGWLVQGRLDLSGPLDGAWLLHQAWPGSHLVVVDNEGHSGASMFSHWSQALAEAASSETARTQRVARTKSEPSPADVIAPGGERPPVTLSDGVVVLRPRSRTDAAFMDEASRDSAIERFNGPAPDSMADAISVVARIEESWRSFEAGGDPTGAALAIVDAASGEPVGMCGIDNWSSTDVAQFGYWLAAGARGRGLATRAVILMTTWLFELGAARVFLTIQSENAASAAVARRTGFAFEGTLRGYGVWRGQRKTLTFSLCFLTSGRRGSTSDRDRSTVPDADRGCMPVPERPSRYPADGSRPCST